MFFSWYSTPVYAEVGGNGGGNGGNEIVEPDTYNLKIDTDDDINQGCGTGLYDVFPDQLATNITFTLRVGTIVPMDFIDDFSVNQNYAYRIIDIKV
jgi:hypothetical protein